MTPTNPINAVSVGPSRPEVIPVGAATWCTAAAAGATANPVNTTAAADTSRARTDVGVDRVRADVGVGKARADVAVGRA
ncbi:hypothetical protein FMUAM8_21660 [Nocardia cyriacigeorgica]|nr:hypothetical protein FMUAM8_21660 [Nocardia cyriacigeorgica]BDU05883.1 hypothetical protein FMUBM48_21460 [Nocardia cyriacigeorgica]